ncbi:MULTISPECIES: PAAR domain-containing protein [unclassified Pseudomonas]|uniref:PAAR domain-containing protein n=1 Tax=unclassified Pseudomonas TaxID=196821 RepID=UPI0021C6AEBD|nr:MULTISPECIES: PAAR domain-containing protein [unclassified Pseudomonas]MCU1732733.1 PAAR domain-containing protein [Pseudomonas sp. 20P_3.2_Bac4]MCU1745040.1 PAAR domain-containing protein [Pseudomonas sp. 20P_3.2_Bac5]
MVLGHLIRIGDKTTCGGQVLTGDSEFIIEGLPSARQGDSVTCGVTGKTYQIHGGIPSFINEGGAGRGKPGQLQWLPVLRRVDSLGLRLLLRVHQQRHGAEAQSALDHGFKQPGQSSLGATILLYPPKLRLGPYRLLRVHGNNRVRLREKLAFLPETSRRLHCT